jgi:hypothetical protein
MIIHVQLPDGRVHAMEAENTSVGHLATQAATQMGVHRDAVWTLAQPGARFWHWPKVLNPEHSAERAGLADGAVLVLYQMET